MAQSFDDNDTDDKKKDGFDETQQDDDDDTEDGGLCPRGALCIITFNHAAKALGKEASYCPKNSGLGLYANFNVKKQKYGGNHCYVALQVGLAISPLLLLCCTCSDSQIKRSFLAGAEAFVRPWIDS